jgi:hypothetical protein
VDLVPALRGYQEGFTERSEIKIDLNLSDDFGRLSTDIEIAIFRVAIAFGLVLGFVYLVLRRNLKNSSINGGLRGEDFR